MRAERGFNSHTLQISVKKMNKNQIPIDSYLETKQGSINTTESNKETAELLYQHGGLTELDYDYYQGECPE